MSDDRVARAWHVTICGMKLSCFVAEIGGRPVEVRIIGGGPLAWLIADFCESLSIGLSHGMTIQSYTRTLRGRRDETGGLVGGDPPVADCGSIVDYIARALNMRYAPDEEATL